MNDRGIRPFPYQPYSSMKIQSILSKKFLRSIGQFFLLALVFGLAYTQAPLYTDNQNTKFLHGLADAGLGFLREDWLANTLDPLPAFTFLVGITYTYLSRYAFYFYYIVIFGVYLYSLIGIVSTIYKINSKPVTYITYIALIIAIHCNHIPIKFGNFEPSLHFHYGVAEQYILGPYFQPCNFGVFIIYSIYAFLRKNHFLAVVSLAIAATFHPAYLISAGVLTLTYMIITYKNDFDLKKVLSIGALAFVSILPVFSYMYFVFRPTSPEVWAKSQDIIVNFRIAHHNLIKVLEYDSSAYWQVLLVMIALFLIRKTQLFLVLLIPFLTATILTLIQYFTGNNTIAFTAPWRMLAFLVPISTCIIAAWLVSQLFEKYQQPLKYRKAIAAFSLASILGFVLLGSYLQVQILTMRDGSIPMLNFVKESKQSGETYLVHTDKKQLRKFRLYTGAPIFINLKSHPYKDVEVVEWYNRNLMAERFYEQNDNRCNTLREISTNYHVTHVVLTKKDLKFNCDFLQQVFKDKRYAVHRINN